MPLTPGADKGKRRPLSICLEPEEPSKVAKLFEGGEGVEGAEVESQAELLEPETPDMCQNPRLQRYLVAVEYIGTKFFGSQKQPNCRTVAGALEEAFIKFVGHPVSAVSSSRTDTGVHALSNVFHVDVERTSVRKPNEVLPPHEPGVVRRAVNHFLQKEGDIRVTDVQFVPTDFHARFRAIERTYFYRLFSGPEPLSLFEKDRAWHISEDLDILAMKKACSILVGHHDFSSFRATGCQAASPVKTLDELCVCESSPFLCFSSWAEKRGTSVNSSADDAASSNVASEACTYENAGPFGEIARHRCFVITARARSFLYHQVRLLVGVLKSVGTGELTPEDVEKILNAKTVSASKPMAPACGLYLGNVKHSFS